MQTKEGVRNRLFALCQLCLLAESLAVSLIVRLVERYLGEYRPLLSAKVECQQTLLDILNIFVEAGWPQARQLTYRIDEIFR